MPPVTTNPYWNPKVETLPKEQLRALKLHKLQRLVDRAYNQSPFHRRLYDDAAGQSRYHRRVEAGCPTARGGLGERAGQ